MPTCCLHIWIANMTTILFPMSGQKLIHSMMPALAPPGGVYHKQHNYR